MNNNMSGKQKFIEVSMSELSKKVNIHIKVKGQIKFKIRNYILFKLLHLAARISPYSIVIEQEIKFDAEMLRTQ